MPATTPSHAAESPEFLASFTASSRMHINLKNLATQYVSFYRQRQRDLAAMTRRGEAEFDLTKGVTTSAQFDRYALRQRMLGIEEALDACLGYQAGKKFRAEIIAAYGLEEDD